MTAVVSGSARARVSLTGRTKAMQDAGDTDDQAMQRRIIRTRFGTVTVEALELNIGRHHVLYLPDARGRLDGISVNGTYFEDRDLDDTFAAELFADLTGMTLDEFSTVAEVIDDSDIGVDDHVSLETGK